MRFRREIDGLRALALLPVIFFHAGFSVFGGGFVGVDIFFVISGYLITTIIIEELKQGRFSIRNFYLRRARRILPALFLVMIVCIPLSWYILLPPDFVSFSKSMIFSAFFSSNVYFWYERGYFGQAIDLKPLIHTWSLAVEEQYYIFFPAFVIFLTKYKSILKTGLFLLFLTSFLLCIWLTSIHRDTAFYMMPTRVWEFLVGSMVAMFLFNKNFNEYKFSCIRMKSSLEIIGLALILCSIFYYDRETFFPGYTAILPVAGTALIIACASERTMLGRMLSSKVLVFIGLISYSAYLWHQPLFSFYRYVNHELTHLAAMPLIVCTFFLAWVTWKYIEQPFRAQTLSNKSSFLLLIAEFLIVVVLGALIVFKNGFIARYSSADALVLENLLDSQRYVLTRFDALTLNNFDSTNRTRKRVLIIGDSYAKDLVNAIYEAGLSDLFEIITYQINSECGNLYLREDFSGFVHPTKLPRCRFLGWYENEKLISLIGQADSIWLASMWSQWVAERLPTSVHSIETDYGKRVLVFGTKNFGDVDVRSLMNVPIDQRVGYTATIDRDSALIQRHMHASFNGDNYIDVASILCGAEAGRCYWFNDIGEPLSFDGGHLTKAGAKRLGLALKDKNLLDKLTR